MAMRKAWLVHRGTDHPVGCGFESRAVLRQDIAPLVKTREGCQMFESNEQTSLLNDGRFSTLPASTVEDSSIGSHRAPDIHWHPAGNRCISATPPGALIHVDWIDNLCANVSLYDSRRGFGEEVIARVRAYLCGRTADIGEEATRIAAAVYWSWWRELEARGEAPSNGDGHA